MGTPCQPAGCVVHQSPARRPCLPGPPTTPLLPSSCRAVLPLLVLFCLCLDSMDPAACRLTRGKAPDALCLQILHPKDHARLEAAMQASDMHSSIGRELDLLKSQLARQVCSLSGAPLIPLLQGSALLNLLA